MALFVVNKTIKISKIQNETLNKLKTKYKINIQDFIRSAIREKIEKDYNKIKEIKKSYECPF